MKEQKIFFQYSLQDRYLHYIEVIEKRKYIYLSRYNGSIYPSEVYKLPKDERILKLIQELEKEIEALESGERGSAEEYYSILRTLQNLSI